MHRNTANRSCWSKVNAQKPFQAHNIFGEIVKPGVYVVYSYGRHFPMYACIHGVWYSNSDGYSRTTAKHKSQAHPGGDPIPLDTRTLEDAIYGATAAEAA